MSTNLNEVDLQDIKEKLYTRLHSSGWGNKFKSFIMSDDFDKILKTLLDEVKSGKRFTPILRQVFRAFEECPYNKLNVVIVGQDPYPYLGVADGIAFSCGNIGKVQASLKFMFKELENTVYPEGYKWDPDLKRWSNQGILLLNSSLTTSVDKVGSHYELWRPFLTFLFDMLSYQNPGLIYVFMGKVAQEWADSVPENSNKIFTSHPASAAHREDQIWNCEDMFNKVSKLLEDNNKEKIIW